MNHSLFAFDDTAEISEEKVAEEKADKAKTDESQQNGLSNHSETDFNGDTKTFRSENVKSAELTTVEESSKEALSKEDRELFRMRRKRLRKEIRKANGYPSFTSLLAINLDLSDDDEENYDYNTMTESSEPEPKVIKIDVDERLRLNETTKVEVPHSYLARQEVEVTPMDEGFYEGVISPVALPEDSLYLSEIHYLIRANLEFFSATKAEAGFSHGGRRGNIVRGKVGIRCIHCARAATLLEEASGQTHSLDGRRTKLLPPGAVSYPLNIAGLYSLLSQKPFLHFETCPNVPDSAKLELLHYTKNTSNTPKARSTERRIPVSQYYILAAKRLGLVDVEDGIRFGRDLSLEPLPLEVVRAQSPLVDTRKEQGTINEPRISADEESERVLAETVAEKDDPDVLLTRSSDKVYVSDFIFLTMRQMAICNAIPMDLTSRGKKTKVMRIGYAGFCCRHCMASTDENFVRDFSCRSFSSAPDNLTSAISNAFVSHLTKCRNVPIRLKKALTAYKRIHQRQMAQLPYGSQRRLFHEIWSRLRHADKTEDEMKAIIDSLPKYPTAPTLTESTQDQDDILQLDSPNEFRVSEIDERDKCRRPENFPISDDLEVQAILKQFEAHWDPKENDFMILPIDLHLISDYVFLTMRQLKLVYPEHFEVKRSRKIALSIIPGISCAHCEGKGLMISPSGRSFPSAPDNFASALNSSLYNHMQVCPYIPINLKRALSVVRKIHSSQCSSLKFGSQRRYFNILYDRLLQINKDDHLPLQRKCSPCDSGLISGGTSFERSQKLGFIRIPSAAGDTFICKKCSFVPFHFRVENSVIQDPLQLTAAETHHRNCTGDDLDFSALQKICCEFSSCLDVEPASLLQLEDFQRMVKIVLGNDEAANSLLVALISTIGNQLIDTNTINTLRKSWTERSGANYVQIAEVFATLVRRHFPGASPNLQNYSRLVDFLSLLNPGIITSKMTDDIKAHKE